MEENIKSLIEKIQQEGIETAQKKAREIEAQAKIEAEAILNKAGLLAEKIISGAAQKATKAEEATQQALAQAARDTLLTLRKEINAMLERLISAEVRQGLSPAELLKIITAMIREQGADGRQDIIITLNKADLDNLRDAFINQARESLKKGIILKPSDDIRAGFIISFDSGKSHFDFTDQALAEYIGQYLKPKLAELLTGSLSQK